MREIKHFLRDKMPNARINTNIWSNIVYTTILGPANRKSAWGGGVASKLIGLS